MSNLTELKNVLTSLGGTPSAGDTNDETIGKIAEHVGVNNRLIVELTPTAADLSGVMEYSVAEITEAYENGKEVVFKVRTADGITFARPSTVYYASGIRYPSFNAYIIDDIGNMLIYAHTNFQDDGTTRTYETDLYTLQSYS